MPDPALALSQWGWDGSAYRIWACDHPPEGEAGWIELNVHRFADAESAIAAVDYFAVARATGTSLILGGAARVGEHSATLSGPASNGKEFTIYASQGPVLVRVTGVSPSGIPFGNVLAVAQAALALQG
jgi:hypothetical protein